MKYKPNLYAQALGLTAEFSGDITEPSDPDTGNAFDWGRVLEKQTAGQDSEAAANLLTLCEAVWKAFDWLYFINEQVANYLIFEWDKFVLLLFSHSDPDPAPDYEPNNTDFPTWDNDLNRWI